MKRLALLLGMLALASTPLADARAQMNTAIQTPVQLTRNGQEVENGGEIYGKIADCEENAEFEFGIDFAVNVPIWEAWLGVGTTNCASASSRMTSSASATNPVCKQLGVDKEATTKPRIKVNARDLFSKDWDAEDEVAQCDEVRKQLYTVYLLPLAQETSLGSNTASEPGTYGNISTRTVTFTVYTLPPDPPTNISGITGESRIGVRYDVIEGAVTKTRYRAYFDWGTGGSGECGSGALDPSDDPDAGAARPPPSGTPDVATETVSSDTAYLEDLDARGIAIGDYVAASVVTVDPAENESALSAPICVKREQTSGFLDNCDADPDCKGGFQSCSLSPGQRAGGALGLLALAGLGAALVLRRRRRV